MNTVEFNTIIRKMKKNNRGIHGYFEYGNGNNTKHLKSDWYKNKIDGKYDKKKINKNELKGIIAKIRNKEIHGMNVTVPFKKDIIPFLDKLSPEAEETKSVNTIYLKNDKVVGHNTDIGGFERAIKITGYRFLNKKILILGAGGVVPSIICSLNKMKVSKIMISNRTKKKAEDLKTTFKNLTIVDWGKVPEFDMIINATSVGLKNGDDLNLNFSELDNNKFYYDVIYNPKETNFLRDARMRGNKTINGQMMFLVQAREAFRIWTNITPKIDDEVIGLLNK